MQTKVCGKCGVEKEITTENFAKRNASKDGFSCKCKQCTKEYYIVNKSQHRVNKQNTKEYTKKYYDANKEKLLKKQKIYKANNKEATAITRKTYRENNKESIKTYHKTYSANNKETMARQTSKYQKNNRDKCNIKEQRRRARNKLLPNNLTSIQWEYIKTMFNNKCAYCGQQKPLAQEHFLALSKGGEYTLNNIIPVCLACNSSKKDKDFFIWYKDYKHYSKGRETKILKYLHYNNRVQQLAFTI